MRILEGHRKEVRCLAYTADSRFLFSGGTDGTVRKWDLATGAGQLLFRSKPRRTVLALARSPDGLMMAWGCGDSVHLADIATGKVHNTLPGHQGSVASVSYSADGKHIAVATKQFGQAAHWGHALWWNAKGALDDTTPQRIPSAYQRALQSGAWSITYDPTGQLMALCLTGHGLVLLNWPDCTERAVVAGGPHGVAFRRDGQRLAAWSDSSTLLVLDVDRPKKPEKLKGHQKWIKSAAFSPDGKLLASGGSDGTVRLWDLGPTRERACFEWQLGVISAVAFAPDGMTAAAAGEKGIVLFDLDVG